MPYITQEKRLKIEPGLSIANEGIENTGDLCYAIFWLMKDYAYFPPGTEGPTSRMNFASASSVLAAVECAKLEFYRRFVAPYEDIKMHTNGDV
jgi:hypothetical protein